MWRVRRRRGIGGSVRGIALGNGKAALRDAIDAGILDVLGPVTSREEFAQRLTAIGIVDRSDTPLPG